MDWESILHGHGNVGELGDYKGLSVLPDKIAGYLYWWAFHLQMDYIWFCKVTFLLLFQLESKTNARWKTRVP